MRKKPEQQKEQQRKKMTNKITSQNKRQWHLVDIEGKILGRIAVEIAHLLMGKSKPEFSKSTDAGDFVIVINAGKVKVTGNKEQKKAYYHHTGYPQGLRTEYFWQLREKNSNKIIIKAVKGMLPKNKLQAQMLKRLYIYQDNTHPYTDKFK